MRLSSQIRPISYLKANAAEIVRELGHDGAPVVITQNGEAKAVLQSVAEYERTQETLALLKILALGRKEVSEGKFAPASESLQQLRREHGLG